MNIVEELRTKKSRDNRELLDRAANRIEELEAETRGLRQLIVNIATEEIAVMTRIKEALQ